MYLSLGMVSLGLGILGIPLPILPTTLFLLLAIACFTRSSKRFEKWLYNTKLYQTYVADFRETKSIAKERKKNHYPNLCFDGNIDSFRAYYLGENCALFLTLFITYCLFKVILIKTDKDKK